ncbi:MAG: VOC family protein [Sulfuriferula sp.]
MNLVSTVHHVSILVADLPRAREFYEGLLGLLPNSSRPELAFDGIWYDIGATQIHLLCVPNPEAGLVRPVHGGRDRHLALTVLHMDRLRARFDRANIPYTLSRSGRNALFCRDPDDNALEFIAALD